MGRFPGRCQVRCMNLHRRVGIGVMQGGHRPHVVEVAVSEQDGSYSHAVGLDGIPDGIGVFCRVDDGALAGGLILQQVTVGG